MAGAAVLLAAAPAVGAAATCAGPADRRAADRAADWLAGLDATRMPAGQLADAIVGLRASGVSRGALAGRVAVLRRVAPAYARTAGASGKVTMAAVAAGADPRRFGGVDYVARILRAQADGRYGTTAWDQALAMLALAGAGERVPPAAVRALRATRGAGGWGFDLRPAGRDQVDVTAISLEALAAAGVPARTPWVVSARSWMLAQRAPGGGFASAGAARPAEGNTTAMVWRSLCAANLAVPVRLRAALRGLQAGDGRVRFTAATEGSALLATNDAVVAFAGRTLPPRM